MAELNRYGEEVGELRVKLPLKLIAMIDGYAHAETLRTERTHGRTDSTLSILSAFFNPKIDEAIVLLKLLGINPTVAEKDSQFPNHSEKDQISEGAILLKKFAEIMADVEKAKP